MSVVTVRYEVRSSTEDGTYTGQGSLLDSSSRFSFQLGVGHVSESLDRMARGLRSVGQEVESQVAASDVTLLPRPSDPSGAGGAPYVDIKMRLLATSDPGLTAHVQQLKEEGNIFYKAKQYTQATRRYRRAIARAVDGEARFAHSAALQAGLDPSPPLPSTAGDTAPPTVGLVLRAVRDSGLLNLSACLLQMGEADQAAHYASSFLALNSDPGKAAKAYFRRGKARAQCNDFEGAVRDLEAALDLGPGDKAVQRALRTTKRLAVARKEKERRAFSGAFGGGDEFW